MTKLTVRWRAMSNAQPHYPELHIPGTYTMWSVNGQKVLVHDPKKKCLHRIDEVLDNRIIWLLANPPLSKDAYVAG